MSIEPWRPQFHFSPQKNWINDPNGLIWFDGEYHLFFQYNPYGDQWGHMSWGHAVSTDLLHWQELPVAIPEDERASIFSGSVVVDEHNSSGFGDGKTPPLIAIYTGCLRRPEGGQAQDIAYSNDRGRTWTKYANNPVLDLGLRDFRDPKVFWHAPTSRWIMAVVLPDTREAIFYSSNNLRDWRELSRFADELTGQGIWECPDIFELPVEGGEKGATAWVFKVDVFEGHPSRGSGARLFFGQFDGTRFSAEPSASPHWADYGADFYAAISWANLPIEQQRAVWIGWMNCHRYAKLLPTQPWRGAMSIPRELTLRRVNGALRLLQQPVRELEAIRRNTFMFDAAQSVQGEQSCLPASFNQRSIEIDLACEIGDSQECGLLLRAVSGKETRVGIDRQRGTVFVDRSRSGFTPDDALFATRREAPCAGVATGRAVRLHVLLDRSSVELFVEDGEVVITEQIFPGDESLDVRLYAQGGMARMSKFVAHELASCHVSKGYL
jgi:fructan beta-fructosidase